MKHFEQIDWTVEPAAHARSTDPITSHEAATSVESKIRWSQRAVRECFGKKGEMTDRVLCAVYPRYHSTGSYDWPQQSPSGLRTRRHELTEQGVIVDSGRAEIYAGSNRRHIIWRLA